MDKKNRRVTAALAERDYMRLMHLAQESSRTASGYFRWLMHRHFKELDRKENSGGQDCTGSQL